MEGGLPNSLVSMLTKLGVASNILLFLGDIVEWNTVLLMLEIIFKRYQPFYNISVLVSYKLNVYTLFF